MATATTRAALHAHPRERDQTRRKRLPCISHSGRAVCRSLGGRIMREKRLPTVCQSRRDVNGSRSRGRLSAALVAYINTKQRWGASPDSRAQLARSGLTRHHTPPPTLPTTTTTSRLDYELSSCSEDGRDLSGPLRPSIAVLCARIRALSASPATSPRRLAPFGWTASRRSAISMTASIWEIHI